MNNQLLVVVLLVVIAGLGYAYWHDQNTTTIDLPGDNKVEITE